MVGVRTNLSSDCLVFYDKYIQLGKLKIHERELEQ